jgi:D-3-phosphoglycerate dehydrogenase
VDEDALFDALKNKRIAGAGMDVFLVEPVESTNRFLELDNVTVTPHTGGDTLDVVIHHSEMIVTDIELFVNGKRPKYLRNPDVFSTSKVAGKKKPKGKK